MTPEKLTAFDMLPALIVILIAGGLTLGRDVVITVDANYRLKVYEA